jgi:opine dehydrogenase
MHVTVLGAGAGGAAAVAELVAAGHEVSLWGRSPSTVEPFQRQAGVAYEGVLGDGLAKPKLITTNLLVALDQAEVALICLPTFAHADIARKMAQAGLAVPVVLDPGHTGGALEFAEATRATGRAPPPIAEFSTLTYVARKYQPGRVTVTGAAKWVRLAALPGGEAAATAARTLFKSAAMMPDVLACDLANINMVLHAPGAILGAAWVEATNGDFTFYAQGMTPGVARVIRALDDERRAVARAFGHNLPSVVAEMRAIGTLPKARDSDDLVTAISSGEGIRRIKAPDSFAHRYYREDFGHGLLPFIALAAISGVAVPTAESLLMIGETLLGDDFSSHGRTAERMGIAQLDKAGLIALVKDNGHVD